MPVKSVNMSFPASDSTDVVSYNLYVEETPKVVSFDSEVFDLGNNTNIDLSILEGMTTKDGIYNLGITAVDDVGNESSMSLLADVPLDFAQPNPPGLITISLQ